MLWQSMDMIVILLTFHFYEKLIFLHLVMYCLVIWHHLRFKRFVSISADFSINILQYHFVCLYKNDFNEMYKLLHKKGYNFFVISVHSSETFLFVLFWIGMIIATLIVIMYYGTEFVDYPKLQNLRHPPLKYEWNNPNVMIV